MRQGGKKPNNSGGIRPLPLCRPQNHIWSRTEPGPPRRIQAHNLLSNGTALYCSGIVILKRDGIRAETRFRLSPKLTSPFKSTGVSVQSTAGSRGVCISVSNAGYSTFRGSVRVLATHSIRYFPLPFTSHASPCAIRLQTHSTNFLLLKYR